MIADVLAGAGAAFLTCAFAAGLFYAARTVIRPLRGPKTPVPGATPSARTAHPALPPGTGPLTSVHFYPGGLTVVDDHMRQRTIEIAPVTEGEADAAFLARIERELREP